jgi:hypothetical protein
VSADAEDHSSSDRLTTTIEYHSIPAATVHCRIVCAFCGDAIEQKLKEISETLQKAGASDVNIEVSINGQAFKPIVTARTYGGWMAPLKGGDE